MALVASHANNKSSLTKREKKRWGHHCLFLSRKDIEGFVCVCAQSVVTRVVEGRRVLSERETNGGKRGGRARTWSRS